MDDEQFQEAQTACDCQARHSVSTASTYAREGTSRRTAMAKSQ